MNRTIWQDFVAFLWFFPLGNLFCSLLYMYFWVEIKKSYCWNPFLSIEEPHRKPFLPTHSKRWICTAKRQRIVLKISLQTGGIWPRTGRQFNQGKPWRNQYSRLEPGFQLHFSCCGQKSAWIWGIVKVCDLAFKFLKAVLSSSERSLLTNTFLAFIFCSIWVK